MRTAVSFYINTEIGFHDSINNLEDFKSHTSKLVELVKDWGKGADADIVVNGKQKYLQRNLEEIDAFESYILENAKEEDGEITFPSDSPYIINGKDHNDIEIVGPDIKNSFALVSPYDGQIDSLNIQVVSEEIYAGEAKDELRFEDRKGFTIHIADDNGDFYELV